MQVEVAFATSDSEFLKTVEVPAGANAMDALEASGFFQQFPEYAELPEGIGIFGKLVKPDTVLKEGDRVEVYRPLQVDPKESRRRRAAAKARRDQAKKGR